VTADVPIMGEREKISKVNSFVQYISIAALSHTF